MQEEEKKKKNQMSAQKKLQSKSLFWEVSDDSDEILSDHRGTRLSHPVALMVRHKASKQIWTRTLSHGPRRY